MSTDKGRDVIRIAHEDVDDSNHEESDLISQGMETERRLTAMCVRSHTRSQNVQ